MAEDSRRRPVVLRTAGAAPEPRRARRYLAWAGTGALGVVAAAGLVAGGTAVWSAFDPGTPGHSPAPLWFPPPETITPQSVKVTPTPTPTPTLTPTPTRTTEPGDDKGGEKKTSAGKSSTTSGKSQEPTSGKSSGDDSRSGRSGSGKSGKSSDDGPNHH